MPWMSDEKYLLMQDTKEKKITARGARHTRTHCGKSGAVKFPSDYLTKKELKAMSGECKTYRLNDPMTWDEFKDMPNDLKISYIQALRAKYDVPDKYIAEMMGVCTKTLSLYLTDLKIGPKVGGGRRHWNKEGFLAWRSGAADAVEPSETPVEEAEEETFDDLVGCEAPVLTPEQAEQVTVKDDSPDCCCSETKILIPEEGELTFKGDAYDILRTIGGILCGAKVKLKVEWEVLEE